MTRPKGLLHNDKPKCPTAKKIACVFDAENLFNWGKYNKPIDELIDKADVYVLRENWQDFCCCIMQIMTYKKKILVSHCIVLTEATLGSDIVMWKFIPTLLIDFVQLFKYPLNVNFVL